MPTYTNNTPQATQTIAFTQPLIEDNFLYLSQEQKQNHTFGDNTSNNAIAGEAPGSHQKLDMPNQAVDITGALPTGIAARMYAIGGNLFSWNGAKQPVSAVTGASTVLLTTSPTTIFTATNDCIGFVLIQTANASFNCLNLSFFIVAGVAYFQLPMAAAGPPVLIALTSAGLNIQVLRASGVNYTAQYKYIYWPI